MNLQRMIHKIMQNPNLNTYTKRKQLQHLIGQLGEYSENTAELEAAFTTTMICIELLRYEELQKKGLK